MIIKNVILTDFRAFQGRQKIDLEPRTKYGAQRPIVLFGGLNGAGKTSILSAIRLALYGKGALGSAVSQREYNEYLRKSIHHSIKSTVQPNSASVELSFDYARQGRVNQYRVVREWALKQSKGKNSGAVSESLYLYENDNQLTKLSSEQCQGFLNELIPVGVSELFFFDGEKIADLATDSKGSQLGEAVKRLIGLDLLDVLSTDLSIATRTLKSEGAEKEIKEKIQNLEGKYEELTTHASELRTEWEQINTAARDHLRKINEIENEISMAGGAWAKTRESELESIQEIELELDSKKSELRECLSSAYPLSIASELADRTINRIARDIEIGDEARISDIIKARISSLEQSISSLVDDSLSTKISELIQKQLITSDAETPKDGAIHHLSARQLANLEQLFTTQAGSVKTNALKLTAFIDQLEASLEEAKANVARAPEEGRLTKLLDALKSAQEVRASYSAKMASIDEQRKATIREAIRAARDLDRLTESLTASSENATAALLAENTQKFIKEFGQKLAARKVKDLELEFSRSFTKLARKDDIHYQAKIDPKSFGVTLVDQNGQEIDKDDLSAGEKQIYAISVLEALARTSGRKLPIIIDTPLGRLDSIHRTKLIENYFPNASHQVIILSTDTEVDENFYSSLSPSISHAYKLDYDQSSRSTKAHEGYFWKNKENKVA